jgi:hypothetical protein
MLQDILQDPAVAEVFELIEGVDAAKAAARDIPRMSKRSLPSSFRSCSRCHP